MDDANLSSLSVNQPGLMPEFKKEITNYAITLAHNIDLLKINAITNDRGASYSIKSNTGYGENVKLNEGENNIQIEVTSEDGTIKKYFLNCTRFPASSAILKSFGLENVDISPKFESNTFEYFARVKYNQTKLKFKFELYDPGCGIEINFNEVSLSKADDSFYNITLNFGLSEIIIKVTSPNKTNNQNYTFLINREAFPLLCVYNNIQEKIEYEDPISFGPIYKSTNLKDLENKIYSRDLIKFFKEICINDQMSLIGLNQDSSLISNFKIEKNISDSQIIIPFLNSEYTKEITLKNACSLIEENIFNKLQFNEDDFKNVEFNNIPNIADSFAAYQVINESFIFITPWEKQLQIIYDETDPEVLENQSKDYYQKYKSCLNNWSNLSNKVKQDSNDSPIYNLNMSIYTATTCLKFKSKDYKKHFWLAMLLEEKNFYENIFGIEKQKDEETSNLNLQNRIAADSSKEEEIDAICKARNVSATASNAEKLKALDQEYHYLIETHQNIKAEQIQQLYQFKTKKIISETKQDNKSNDYSNYIYQSNIKFLHGIGLIAENKQTNFSAYFAMGRSFCLIGEHKQALSYFKACLNWSDLKLKSLSKYYFAYSLFKQGNLDEKNFKIILYYLGGGLEIYLENISKNLTNDLFYSEDYFSIFNIQFLEGFLLIGKIQNNFNIKSGFITSENCFKYCAWLCCLSLIELSKKVKINQELYKNSKLLKDILNLLIESHFQLTDTISHLDQDLKLLEIKRCLNFIDLIRCIKLTENEDYLRKQEKITQKLVFIYPFESYFLLLLSCSKLELYDLLYDNKLTSDTEYLNELLEESKNSLLVCNEYLSNKSFDNISNLLTDQKWWKKFQNELIRPVEKVKDPKPRITSGSKTEKVEKSKTQPVNIKPASVKKPQPVPVQAKKTTQPKIVNNPPAKNTKECKSEPATINSIPTSNSNPPVSNEQPTETKIELIKKLDLKLNIKKEIINYQIELYSARVYSRLKQFDKSKEFYLNVIKKEPKKQEAYIELANMLKQNNDIMGAVDVYSSYPIENEAKNENFDDAFIYGELVSLLISIQNYDDKRLTKYLILWAQIMGISVIEKYINILDKANKTKACKEVYASVHKKSIDDPDLNQFFKFKGWL